MSADSYQVMRVLDRCLDTAESDSDTGPDVAAAAARAKADPGMHDAISALLAEEPGTAWGCFRGHGDLAAAKALKLGDNLLLSCSECHDKVSPVMQVFTSCAAASGVAGEPDAAVAVTLAQLFLAAIMVERSSLGDDRSRRLRNTAAHGAVAAAVYSWRSLAAHGPPARQPRSARSPEPLGDSPGR